MERKIRINIWYVIFAILCVLLVQMWLQKIQQIEVIPYSEFERYLRDGRIAEILVTERHIQGVLEDKSPLGRNVFSTTRIETDLARELAKYDVTVTGGTEESFAKDIISWVVPMLVFFGIWMFIVRRVAD